MSADDDKRTYFTMSHLGIIRLFVIWGILESIVFIFTKGDRFKSLTVYTVIFLLISIIAYMSPTIIDFL
jgi:hypothetical protein